MALVKVLSSPPLVLQPRHQTRYSSNLEGPSSLRCLFLFSLGFYLLFSLFFCSQSFIRASCPWTRCLGPILSLSIGQIGHNCPLTFTDFTFSSFFSASPAQLIPAASNLYHRYIITYRRHWILGFSSLFPCFLVDVCLFLSVSEEPVSKLTRNAWTAYQGPLESRQ
jgi:hypothetical protein